MRVVGMVMLAVAVALSACSTATPELAAADTSSPAGADTTPTTVPPRTTPEVEPQPFQPAGPVGSATQLNDLIELLADEVPAALRGQVPWPDLTNPDPVVAQLAIFDLWIWMAENHPEPRLAEVMAAPRSPSREEIAGIFGRRQAANELLLRTGAPYVAFDHRVVTFETAGLPLWLARDVPDDAVVVYYQDQSGPSTVIDAESGDVVGEMPAVGARQWLSIMVPTDIGWMLFRDQLIEPGDTELPVPESAPPSPGAERRTPEV